LPQGESCYDRIVEYQVNLLMVVLEPAIFSIFIFLNGSIIVLINFYVFPKFIISTLVSRSFTNAVSRNSNLNLEQRTTSSFSVD